MRLRLRVLYALLSFILLSPSSPGFGQAEGPRVTPLGTKLPMPDRRLKKEVGPEALEDVDEILRRTVEVHGGRALLDSVRDFLASGKITFFGMEGPKSTFDVILVRKGRSQVQRTIKQRSGELRQGSNGDVVWESFNGMTRSVLGGLVGNFVESQTTRSVDTFFESERNAFTVRHLGMKHDSRVLEVDVAEMGKPARKTRYSVDKETWRVKRVEWVTGEVTPMFGALVPTTEAYVLSDFRKVQGILTPFEIERYVNGAKIEETHFSTVRYNASVKDDVFQP